MSHSSSILYHLAEQAIATDPADPRHAYPEIRPSERILLDLGCGIGQSRFAVGGEGRTIIGIDVDGEALRHGHAQHHDHIVFVRAGGEAIPLADGSVDLVFSRVAIPYMNVPKALRDIRRVLRPGGRVWLSVHTSRMTVDHLWNAARRGHLKCVAHDLYVLANGFSLAVSGVVWPFVNGRYESWQGVPTMLRLLRQNGFEARALSTPRHSIVEGILTAAA